MDTKKVIQLGSKWRGAVLAAVATGLVLAWASGCHKTAAQADDASAEVVGAAGPETNGGTYAAAAEVTPPAPVVAADPGIPLNEAVVGAAPIPADYSAAIAPPAPVVEEEPSQPEPDDAWIPGYWWWSLPLGRYVWVSGAWRRPPPDQVWSPGEWTLVDGRYIWAPGYWGPSGYARVTIDLAPPPLRFEAYVAPPGVGFVWTPGYYGYHGGTYVWVGGSWLRPPRVGLGWIEPRYVSIGGRYTLQPGRWDFPPERRGMVYRPDINVRAGAHLSLAPVPQGIVSAHANFVSAAAHAIARGATRTPNGGYAVHRGGNEPHGNESPGGNEARGGAGPGPTRENEPHGGGGAPGGNEARLGGIPRGESEGHAGPAPREAPLRGAAPVEEHRGAAPVEEHRGAAPVEEHRGAAPVVEHRGAAPVEEHRGAAPMHGAAPVVEHVGPAPAHGPPPERRK
jgi:hypothetical protein